MPQFREKQSEYIVAAKARPSTEPAPAPAPPKGVIPPTHVSQFQVWWPLVVLGFILIPLLAVLIPPSFTMPGNLNDAGQNAWHKTYLAEALMWFTPFAGVSLCFLAIAHNLQGKWKVRANAVGVLLGVGGWSGSLISTVALAGVETDANDDLAALLVVAGIAVVSAACVLTFIIRLIKRGQQSKL